MGVGTRPGTHALQLGAQSAPTRKEKESEGAQEQMQPGACWVSAALLLTSLNPLPPQYSQTSVIWGVTLEKMATRNK